MVGEETVMRREFEQNTENKLYIVMYHYTRDIMNSRYPRIQGLDLALFREQIQFFKEKFQIVTMEEVINAVNGRYKLPQNALLITFDDGYIDNFVYAMPILEQEKVQGSFFIPAKTFSTHDLLDVNKIHYILASANSNELILDIEERMNYYRGGEYDYAPTDDLFAEYAIADRLDCKETVFIKQMLQTVLPQNLRKKISSDLFEKYVGVSEKQLAYELYMTEEQIRTMRRHGMFIGLHGYDHYWLGNLPENEMKEDINKALDVMDEFIDRKCWVMNYPYGNYNEQVIEHISSCGCCLGLTTEARIAYLDLDNKYKLPRFDCNDFLPKSEKYKKYKKYN